MFADSPLLVVCNNMSSTLNAKFQLNVQHVLIVAQLPANLVQPGLIRTFTRWLIRVNIELECDRLASTDSSFCSLIVTCFELDIHVPKECHNTATADLGMWGGYQYSIIAI